MLPFDSKTRALSFILQKVGDSYIFIHRMIREHFAEMDIDAFMQWVETHEAQVN